MNNSDEFIKLETAGAKLLLGATILALIFSNSWYYAWYDKLFSGAVSLNLGAFHFSFNLKFVINEILMTFFFLLVGIKIKYEFLLGSLNSYNKAILPVIAAIGGMLIPAFIYLVFNYHNIFNLRGWAIPTATDIAFSLGILSLLGSRIIPALKTFLTTLAVIDDLFAIIIIAFFYTDHLSLLFLIISLLCLLLLLFLTVKKITYAVTYWTVAIGLWISFLLAGIHPTLAGVALALSLPLSSKNPKTHSWLLAIVTLVIMPLFAFANAGIGIFHIASETLHFSIILGILFSLFLGKQFGIFAFTWLSVKLGIGKLPDQVRWIELYGVALLCGIGFTISLFIGTLAYSAAISSYIDSVKIGVLIGSFLSGLSGYLLLYFAKND